MSLFRYVDRSFGDSCCNRSVKQTFFALIVDEATDVSHNEQMWIAIRWVDSRYTIHKDAIGLIQLPDTKSVTLFSTIKDVLIRCSLPLSTCIGQSHDGAANMSGVRNGVQALLKKEDGHCLYVHCFVNSLNLCIKDVTQKCELLRNCMDFIFQLLQLIRFSPKRLNLLRACARTFRCQKVSQVCLHHRDHFALHDGLFAILPL